MATTSIVGLTAAQADGEPPTLRQLTERLDREQPLIMGEYGVPGAAVAVVRQGEAVWSTGYGDAAAGEPMTADTVFQVASISKTLTAWGVMRLVESGQVSLEAPIADYVTRWSLPPSDHDASGVTVARVMSHTAGFNRVDGHPLPVGEQLPTLEESLSGDNGGGQSLRIEFEPGRGFHYSNAGYTLLQLMIEEVTGERFSDYMQAAILDPLGMTDSTYDPTRVTAQATGHYASGQPLPHYRLTEQAAGGLYSTANDLALLVAASMAGPAGEPVGRGVLTSESVRTMMAPQQMPDGSVVSLGHLNDQLDDGFTTTGNNGHNIGWITNMVIVPELGEGIVILTNSDVETTGLGLRAWTQWLGVSDTFTTQASMVALDETSTIMLVGAGLLLALAGALLVVALVQALVGRRRRRWLWRSRHPAPRIAIRGSLAALAIAGLIAVLVLPERPVYETLLPIETAAVLVAVVCSAAAALVFASTRRAHR
ncbi:serine hydrolase domain-containing protein [Agrococcus beijingensis]|uniref:serine hydrolase domain-containing protein n=1 Tax=Agrococcus beijingensis TaxID=3068634 RepID=UPI0027424F9F|nr:serine hydrolase domain-containing protein [Agrococcus sp. REN33]